MTSNNVLCNPTQLLQMKSVHWRAKRLAFALEHISQRAYTFPCVFSISRGALSFVSRKTQCAVDRDRYVVKQFHCGIRGMQRGGHTGAFVIASCNTWWLHSKATVF